MQDPLSSPSSRFAIASGTALLERASDVAALAARQAASLDGDGSFPVQSIEHAKSLGLLSAPFPIDFGGEGVAVAEADRLRPVLTAIGGGSLALGRLYEGHVNAVALAARYGSAANLSLLKQEADAGRPSGVWMAGQALKLERDGGRLFLKGRKILCSGAGHFRRPLVAANFEGGSIMLLPYVVDPQRVDTSCWTAHGMRATATGTVDFSDIEVTEDEIVGKPGDYLQPPYFRGGAWRVIAVQLGAVEALLTAYKTQLSQSPHRNHPIQLARLGEAEIACETARLWVKQASVVAEGAADDPERIDAYVDLARNAFEAAALRLLSLAQKAIGLNAFLRPNTIERIVRDLTTYLRQPALDVSLVSAAEFHLQNACVVS